MRKLKEIFKESAANAENCTVLVVAVKLPSGAIETISNHNNIPNKVQYYLDSYNDDFRLRANPGVQIVDFMMV